MRASETATVDLVEVRATWKRKRRSALRHRVEYEAFRAGVGVLRLLPDGSAARLNFISVRPCGLATTSFFGTWRWWMALRPKRTFRRPPDSAKRSLAITTARNLERPLGKAVGRNRVQGRTDSLRLRLSIGEKANPRCLELSSSAR